MAATPIIAAGRTSIAPGDCPEDGGPPVAVTFTGIHAVFEFPAVSVALA